MIGRISTPTKCREEIIRVWEGFGKSIESMIMKNQLKRIRTNNQWLDGLVSHQSADKKLYEFEKDFENQLNQW